MALTNTDAVVKATATASQTVFDISDITFYETTDIQVYANGSLVASGYTVDVSAQTVTFDTGRTAGDLMVFQRVLPRTQEKTYTVQGKFPAASHENGLDRNVALVQELEEKVDRGIAVPVTHTASSWDGSIPDPGLAANKGKPFRIKTDGTGVETFTIDSSDTLNVLTTEGDLINGGTSGVGQRLAAPSNDGALLYRNDATTGDLKWSSTGPSAEQHPVSDGTDWMFEYLPDNALATLGMPVNCAFTATLSTNDIVITLTGQNGSAPSATNPVWIPFRSSTANSGAYTWEKQTAAETLTLPSTGTLGATASEQIRFYVYAVRNGANDIELAMTRQALWSGDTLQSTTAIGTGSDSTTVLYSTTARTSKPIQLIGVVEVTSAATPGQWSTIDLVTNWRPGMRKTGDVVQRLISSSGAVATGTTVFVDDDTIPQITEGTEYFSQAITPTSAINKIEIVHKGVYARDAGASLFGVAIFQTGTNDAIGSLQRYLPTAANPYQATIYVEKLAGSTSALTFSVRAGTTTAGTTTLNGFSSARKWGGNQFSYITVTERYV